MQGGGRRFEPDLLHHGAGGSREVTLHEILRDLQMVFDNRNRVTNVKKR